MADNQHTPTTPGIQGASATTPLTPDETDRELDRIQADLDQLAAHADAHRFAPFLEVARRNTALIRTLAGRVRAIEARVEAMV